MSKMICFFSSDEAHLYQLDIFRALALPNAYILHFRYKPELLDETIVSPKSLKARECVIFFAKNNNPDISKEKRQIEIVSVRKAKVKHVDDRSDTGLIHFYLELNNFADINIVDSAMKDKIPPNKFVSELMVEEGNKNEWIERVEGIKDKFPNAIFFNINSIKNNKKIIRPSFSKIEKESYYKLFEEHEYALDLSFSDTSNGKAVFKNEIKSNRISINLPEELYIGASADNRTFTFITHSLDIEKTSSFVKFYSCFKDICNDIILKFCIERKKRKPWILGCLSIAGLLALVASQITIELIKKEANNSIILPISPTWFLVIALTLAFGSAYISYIFFNKK